MFYHPPPHHPSKLTGKTAIRVIFILFSLLGNYLTAENRDWTEIVALGGYCSDGTFAPIVYFTRDSLTRALCPLLALSKEICRLSGAGPRGGVQPRGQQGVPLPDKNRLFCARATQITFPASLSFLVYVARDLTPEAFNFALSGPRPHLYGCAVHVAAFSFFLLFTVGRRCFAVAAEGSPSPYNRRAVSFPLPGSQVKLKSTVTCREQARVCSLSVLLFDMT